jgi:hypothetical protein
MPELTTLERFIALGMVVARKWQRLAAATDELNFEGMAEHLPPEQRYLLDRWLYELQTFDISAQDLDFVGSIAFIDDDLEDDV